MKQAQNIGVPLSVCLLACDEEEELSAAIGSVAFADEIVVVVDAKSKDGSEEVARRLASRVERRAYRGDVEQKRYATSLAKHDWVLILDPDEVIPPLLGESIQRVLSEGSGGDETDAPVAYRLNRATYHLGRWIRHGDFYPDWKLRLFRQSKAEWVGRDPHGRVEVKGRVGDLAGDLEHYSYRDLSDQIDRIQFFSGQAAAALKREGASFQLSHLILRPPARFLRTYVLRRGFRDGLPGFVISVASAFYVFLKYAKLWEKTRNKGAEKPRP